MHSEKFVGKLVNPSRINPLWIKKKSCSLGLAKFQYVFSSYVSFIRFEEGWYLNLTVKVIKKSLLSRGGFYIQIIIHIDDAREWNWMGAPFDVAWQFKQIMKFVFDSVKLSTQSRKYFHDGDRFQCHYQINGNRYIFLF